MRLAAIDLGVLNGIRAVGSPGPESELARIVGTFMDDSMRMSEEIADAICVSDAERLYLAAHTLKSSSAKVGALQVSDLSRQLEEAGRNGDLAEAAPLLEGLLVENERARFELSRIFEVG